MKTLSALPYAGGKSALSSTGTGRWVASLLPYDRRYIEPFGGMFGVGLQRAPSRIEVLNDLDGRVSNWWTVVRDQWDRLAAMLERTPPWSRQMYWQAVGKDMTSGVYGAYWYTLVALWSFASISTASGPYSYATSNKTMPITPGGVADRLATLTGRMRNVAVENCDAVDLIRGLAPFQDAVIYVDPPYVTAQRTKTMYIPTEFDLEALTGALTECEGAVAVSGYPGEWDHLGWHRSEHHTRTQISRAPRVECLWTNYKLGGQSSLFHV